MTAEEGAMDLHEYADDVAADAIRDYLPWAVHERHLLTPFERAVAHAVADAVADLGAA